MRKPRDFDTELKALDERARHLRARKVQQLGELVIATRADILSIEQLAGALIAATEAPSAVKEDWRGRGALFFRTRAQAGRGADGDAAQPGAGDELALSHPASPRA